ncbi:CsgG/HfaB family protein [Noviherbaspirillum saxi]|uniref:Curli production assembly/transport protein CsgG n=1 Tax=Noviherbaspirillum saxi TaxID=2320863 RepID=A0A3A3FVU2_9BURK|nr:CsgG/HfaB family protein [Noviherbaspirillum saxi]RJF99444.1 curli production assembly/transport protein CsgG [Noviherbaspirillum saxi]
MSLDSLSHVAVTWARMVSLFLLVAFLSGCASMQAPSNAVANAKLTPPTRVTRDLLRLPEPKGKVVAAVYGFRDQTGQYKPAPDSSFSTTVTQGAASMLVKALKDSGWFTPVERENLQNLLTERKIVRALETPQDKNPTINLPALVPATILIEGGIVAYETNVRTGGAGARYLGVGAKTQYRVDQVTVTLRTVDIRSGQILNSVSTTKTIYSYELSTGVFRFVNFKELLELEAGYTRNEPSQLCVKEAIEAGVAHLIVQGLQDKVWALKNDADWRSPVLQAYLKESSEYLSQLEDAPAVEAEPERMVGN